MALRLLRASRRALVRPCVYFTPLAELPSLLFSHGENSRRSELGHLHAAQTADFPLHGSRSPWIVPTDHRLCQRRRFEFPGGFHSILRFSAALSSSSEKAEQQGHDAGGDRKHEKPATSASLVEKYAPRFLQPYARLARLDKPIGIWLMAWPSAWSITIAAAPGSLPDLKILALFGCGAVLLRGAGCTINDILDRDIDSKMERTKSRPIASGAITPFQGLSFLGFQLLLGLGILLQLNDFSQVLGASSLPLIFSYPLMKRFTYWPQAYLGLTFNWGALLGWAAVKGTLDLSIVLPLYSAGVFWTIVYDTIYAYQDKEDDMRLGVKSTALRFGDLTKNWISGFGMACISCLILSGYNAELEWPYYACLGLAAGQLGWQILVVDLSNHMECNKMFVSNKWFGALVFTGILLGRLAA